ncbi:hypothetical protein H4219_002416, partial [Mycoemilia scoparia]
KGKSKFAPKVKPRGPQPSERRKSVKSQPAPSTESKKDAPPASSTANTADTNPQARNTTQQVTAPITQHQQNQGTQTTQTQSQKPSSITTPVAVVVSTPIQQSPPAAATGNAITPGSVIQVGSRAANANRGMLATPPASQPQGGIIVVPGRTQPRPPPYKPTLLAKRADRANRAKKLKSNRGKPAPAPAPPKVHNSSSGEEVVVVEEEEEEEEEEENVDIESDDDASERKPKPKDRKIKIKALTERNVPRTLDGYELEVEEEIPSMPMSYFCVDQKKGRPTKRFIEEEKRKLRKKQGIDLEEEEDQENEAENNGSNADATKKEEPAVEMKRPAENNLTAQVRVVDGEVVLDLDSVMVNRSDMVEASEVVTRKLVDESDKIRIINSLSYLKPKGTRKRWTLEETELFFKGLRKWGTDFQMISNEIPNRNRYEVKTKFKAEEKLRPDEITKAILRR